MKPFNVMFEEKNCEEIYYKNNIIKRSLIFKNIKKLKFSLSFISTNSIYNQAIVLLFSDDFKGTIIINNKKFNLPKIKFPKICFWQDTSPQNIQIEIFFEKGFINLCNGADPIGDKKICSTLTFGSAMICEKRDNNSYLVKCNDFENDDDFDDLIFEISIEERTKNTEDYSLS